MDQIKIGRFIAEQRKMKGCTQRQLAEQLGISDKTISKWECGKGFPEVSLLLPLCTALDISVNELLSGESLSDENYKLKAEENMMNLVQEAQESRKKIILSVIVAALAIISGVTMFLVSGLTEIDNRLRIVLLIIGFAVVAGGVAVACVLDRDAGAFECPDCGKRFVPDMTAYVMGAHTLTMRKLKCPYCGKKHYCKHVLTK